MRLTFATVLALLASASCSFSEVTIVPRGSVWKFYYNGALPANWNQTQFSDATWPSGPAQLGYGEGDEKTIAFDDPGDAPPTIYFRRSFDVQNPSSIVYLTLRVVADDGAIVYLNGAEIFSRNMPSGPPTFLTAASVNLQTNENSFVQIGLAGLTFKPTNNLIAVEVHQHPAGFLDCSFDLELLGNLPAASPRISITAPSDGDLLSSGDILIQTDVSDADGHVTQVQFYTNTVPFGEALAPPFSFLWHNPPVGRYTLTARATDDVGIFGFSPLVHLQVGQVNPPLKLMRGPYLQSGTASSMIVRWRTDWLADSLLRYGTNEALLDQALSNAAPAADHELTITGLQPDTRYFYSVVSAGQILAEGPEFFFRTAPTSAVPFRIWAIGDSGTADYRAAAVRDGYYPLRTPGQREFWMMLGDNSYSEGSDFGYQGAIFDMYSALLRQSVLWPTLGNHDGEDMTNGSPALYESLFTLPKAGEAGGVPSGSELYYSFEYANVHIICLDSFLTPRSTNGAMLTWLQADLAATDKDWIIAFWHHPAYSWGEHNSDLDSIETEMRERVMPILESYGVDLVLSGHSHSYERSFLIDGHYGHSSTFQPPMALDSSLGRPDVSPYRKPAGGLGANKGGVYLVCGCSGQGGSEGVPLHPAMAVAHGGYGSTILDIDGLVLNARFLRPSGEIDDYFAIDKSTPVSVGPPLQISRTTNGALISWPTSLPAFNLESAPSVPFITSENPAESVVRHGRRNTVAVDFSKTNRFFQLRAAP